MLHKVQIFQRKGCMSFEVDLLDLTPVHAEEMFEECYPEARRIVVTPIVDAEDAEVLEDVAILELIDYLTVEADSEIGAVGEITLLGKKLQRMANTAKLMRTMLDGAIQ